MLYNDGIIEVTIGNDLKNVKQINHDIKKQSHKNNNNKNKQPQQINKKHMYIYIFIVIVIIKNLKHTNLNKNFIS